MTIKVENKSENLEQGITNLIDCASLDFKNWSKGINAQLPQDTTNEVVLNLKLMGQVTTFKNNFKINKGKKYIKVINQGVFCFIVINDFNKNGKTFLKGDILKPSSWATPALNKARGNVLTGNYPIEWTGPQYLR